MEARPDCTLVVVCNTTDEFTKAASSLTFSNIPRLFINIGPELSAIDLKEIQDGDRHIQAVDARSWHTDPIGFASRLGFLYTTTWGVLICKASHMADQQTIVLGANHLAKSKTPYRGLHLWGATRDTASIEGLDLIRPLGDDFNPVFAIANAASGEVAPASAVCEILCSTVPMFKVCIEDEVHRASPPIREIVELMRREILSYDIEFPKCIVGTSAMNLAAARSKVGSNGSVVVVDTKLPHAFSMDYDRRMSTSSGAEVIIFIGTQPSV